MIFPGCFLKLLDRACFTLAKYKVQAEITLTNGKREYSIKRDLYPRGKRYI